MQLTLGFLASPTTQLPLWNELDPEARAELVANLARLIANASQPQEEQEVREHDD